VGWRWSLAGAALRGRGWGRGDGASCWRREAAGRAWAGSGLSGLALSSVTACVTGRARSLGRHVGGAAYGQTQVLPRGADVVLRWS
jgi:hypothetical protein